MKKGRGKRKRKWKLNKDRRMEGEKEERRMEGRKEWTQEKEVGRKEKGGGGKPRKEVMK